MVRKLGQNGAIEELKTYYDYCGYDFYTMSSARTQLYDKEINYDGIPATRVVGSDCSAMIYTYLSLVFGKKLAVGNTETLYNDLINLGYREVSNNTDWDAKRGDIFIWSLSGRGTSAGANGHTGVFIDDKHVLNSNYGHNGIWVDDYNQMWDYVKPYVNAYRLE